MSKMTVVALIPPSLTVHYDEMCRAITEAHRIDEVKHIRDKARAIEVYAQMAQNVEAESLACQIRLRAGRRLGEMLKERDVAKRGPDRESGGRAVRPADETLADLGISKSESSRYQQLAAVPQGQFDKALAQPKPTMGGIIAAHSPPSRTPATNPVDDRALWLWGRLEDFERNGLFESDPNDLIETMLPHMKLTTEEYAPRVVAWLGRIRL